MNQFKLFFTYFFLSSFLFSCFGSDKSNEFTFPELPEIPNPQPQPDPDRPPIPELPDLPEPEPEPEPEPPPVGGTCDLLPEHSSKNQSSVQTTTLA